MLLFSAATSHTNQSFVFINKVKIQHKYLLLIHWYMLIWSDGYRWNMRWKQIMKYCFNRLSIFSLIVLFILMNLCDHSLFYEVEPGIPSTSVCDYDITWWFKAPCDRSMKIQSIINSHSLGNDVALSHLLACIDWLKAQQWLSCLCP